MNFKERQEVRKDQAILEHLVFKYGKNDVLQYINEGRFADFTRKVGRGIANVARTLKDWAVNVTESIMSNTLPAAVSVVLADDAAAAAGLEANANVGISEIEADIEQDIAECEKFWETYMAHANVSEGYMNRLNRKWKKLNEAQATPEGNFVKLEADARSHTFNVNTKKLKAEIKSRLKKRMNLGDQIQTNEEDVLLIWGAPGIGKTAIVKQMLLDLQKDDVAKRKMSVIDTRLASMDYDDFFLPAVNKNEKGQAIERADVPAAFLPVYRLGTDAENVERNEKANRHAGSEFGGVLFFDEFSRANRGVHQVLMKLIDERQLGEYRLGDRWSMIAAANRKVDMSDEADFSWEPAFARRFSQVNFVPTMEEWLNWAKNEGHIRHDIIEFLEAYPIHWYEAIIDDESATAGMTPAGWTTLSHKWDDLEQYDSEWNLLDDESRVQRKLDALKAKAGVDIFRKDHKSVEGDMDDYLSVFRHFPKSECKKVWKDGEKITPSFVQTAGNIAQVIKAIFIERPNKKEGVLPTPEEYGKFLAFCMNLDHPSKRQMAIENMKQLIRINISNDFTPDRLSPGNRPNPYYDISKAVTSKLGADYDKKGSKL